VRLHRFRLVSMMVVVAMVAFNAAAMQMLNRFTTERDVALVFGAVPMANLLAVGTLVILHRGDCPAFLLGFEAFGVVALTLYVTWIRQSAEQSVMPYLHGALVPVVHTAPWSVVSVPVAAFRLGWPLLALALLGGFLFSESKIAERPGRTRG
jgi:hypothetical protein